MLAKKNLFAHNSFFFFVFTCQQTTAVLLFTRFISHVLKLFGHFGSGTRHLASVVQDEGKSLNESKNKAAKTVLKLPVTS